MSAQYYLTEVTIFSDVFEGGCETFQADSENILGIMTIGEVLPAVIVEYKDGKKETYVGLPFVSTAEKRAIAVQPEKIIAK